MNKSTSRPLLLLLILISQSLHAQFPGWEWARSFGGSGYDLNECAILDHSGNIITIGLFHDTVDFDPGPGTYNLTSFGGGQDIFISKIDSNGNLVWARSFGEIHGDWGMSVAVDSDDNCYLTGLYSGPVDFDPGPGTFILTDTATVFVLKLNAQGNFVWAVSMELDNSPGIGSGIGNCILVDNQQNIYVTGPFSGQIDFDPGIGIFNMTGNTTYPFSTFMVKLDSAANFRWAKKVGGSFTDYGSNPLTLDDSCNIYFTGYFMGTVDFDPGPGVYNMTNPNGNGPFISKTDSSGNFVWAKQYAGSGFGHGYSVTIDPSGSIYNMGYFLSSIDFDPGPGTFLLNSGFGEDVFLTKLDPNGNFIWVKSFSGSTYTVRGYALSSDLLGNLYLAGYFTDTVDFDPGPAVHYMISDSGWSNYLIKLDTLANLIWTCTLTSGSVALLDISLDPYGNGYFSGGFVLDSMNFGPYTLYNTNTTTNIEMFTAKFGSSFSGIDTYPEQSPILIYPNPVTDKIFIKSRIPVTSINISDISGRMINNFQYTSVVSETIEVTLKDQGVYFIEVIPKNGDRKVEKVVKIGH